MNSPYFGQMLDALDQGIIILDREGTIVFFNNWMVLASGIEAAAANGHKLLGLFPQLDTPLFHRNFQSVLSFGNTAFFTHKTSPWLIPLPPAPGSPAGHEHMQQSGQMGPLRENGEIRFAYLIIRDITETVSDVQHLTRMAMHDALTGTWNRRWFDHWLAEEIDRAQRYQRRLSLVMFDLDHFKQVNDRYGHPAGDRVLGSVATCCGGLIRTIDTLARFGGEEFCVILPETDSAAASALAERLRSGVASLAIQLENASLNITISLGVASFQRGMDSAGFLQAADSALYRAKEGGRNRVAAETA
jgi:diguanylate cyclase (GGDEF)-like protein